MGVIPSSISVPRFDARMTRIQYSGSAESDDMMPYSGTCEQTKKMRRVTAVHSTFWLKGTWKKQLRLVFLMNRVSQTSARTLRSGDDTSGRKGRNGRTRLRNRTVQNVQHASGVVVDGEETYIRSCWRRGPWTGLKTWMRTTLGHVANFSEVAYQTPANIIILSRTRHRLD